MILKRYLAVGAILFCLGIYGVLARRNGIMVLMAIELMLAASALNLVAFGAFRDTVQGQVFALFVLGIAAAEVGLGLAIMVQLYRQRRDVNIDTADELRG